MAINQIADTGGMNQLLVHHTLILKVWLITYIHVITRNGYSPIADCTKIFGLDEM
jgi:hypothetical protein